MPRKKAQIENLAGRLHSVLTQIMNYQAANPKAVQDAVLYEVFQVAPASENRPILLDRLARLQTQPDELHSVLRAEGVPEKLLGWYMPVKTALLTLCGSSHENLQGFIGTAVFVDALARLDTCEAVLGTDELSWDVTALNDASSAESVGEFWFGQVAKCVIQSDFQCPGGAEPIRPFGDHSGLSVEAFDNATGELPPGSEPVQNQVAVRAQPCGQPPSSGRAASASSGCTSGRGTGRPSTATRSPTAIESPP